MPEEKEFKYSREDVMKLIDVYLQASNAIMKLNGLTAFERGQQLAMVTAREWLNARV